jgi:4-hydroxy 2-oxovalerate aldolase
MIVGASRRNEADVSIQHFGLARDLGMETVGFLMMAHKTTPAEMARQARIMVDAGAECVYCVDSAGALVLGDAQERVQAMFAEIGHQAEIGFHGHQNLSLGVANSVLAYQHGARQVDGALCALGAGAGNSPTEVLAATFDHLGVPTGVDVGGVLAAAEEVVRPFLPRWPKMDRSAIVQGWAGVYSSFLLHAVLEETVLEETVVEAQGVVECVHFVVVEHADPVVQLRNVDAEHLLEEYAAFPAVDLGLWPGKAGPGRGGSGGDGHD